MATRERSLFNPNRILAPLLQNLFQYRDEKDQLKTMNLPGPARISEHVILEPDIWESDLTVRGVVHHDWEDYICAMCRGWGHNTRKNTVLCLGGPCLAAFRTRAADTENNRIELRVTPTKGLGVFARTNLPAGRVLGEYLGELRPEEEDPDDIDHYQYVIEGVAAISATRAGNWTRFLNHHCNPNLSVKSDMYGRRRAIVFRTKRPVSAGEELSVDYGDPRYFEPLRIDCACDAFAQPHQLGGAPAMFSRGPAVTAQYLPYTGSQFMQIRRREPSPEPVEDPDAGQGLLPEQTGQVYRVNLGLGVVTEEDPQGST
ncbi:hypothetical protein KVR01_004344 [Diaporthe batatas]|uniref:uncharacterized protein n=1 Tax=Diaporthe batatas TaxID=748121 RepID=UPI001D03B046|nr:uncharacterized protein KVR01_004344 [Diaporthe batatas]KAG8165792.1 hypothetical protein KVR01_004344 [Diaporthe batatas]